jgi:hypothetical protein
VLGLVVWEIYWLWNRGPWTLPNPGQSKSTVTVEKSEPDASAQRPVNTEIIISKNLFDPERGAGATRESEANSRAVQRIRGMILLGTAIIGNSRLAILQDAGAAPAVPGSAGQAGSPMRVKQGDVVEGFNLSEVGDRRVVFSRGSSRVELVLDYFRKVESSSPTAAGPARGGQVRPPTPVAPRVIPALPRRQPTPPNPGGDTKS